MVDDQNKPFDPTQNKASTIDDLVKELSKNSSPNQSRSQSDRGPSTVAPSRPPPMKATESQGPPPNLPGIKIENRPPAPLTSAQPEPTKPITPLGISGMSRPQAPGEASSKPFTSPPPPPAFGQVKPLISTSSPKLPTSSGPVSTSQQTTISATGRPAQEYRSSIRTMGEDIASIKSGQKPLGVDIPRKITPEMPKAPAPATLKSEEPLSSGPRPAVGLGRAEKTGSLPFTPTSKGPETPKPPIIQPPIVVPEKKRRFLSPMFYISIAGALVIGGILYWYLILRAPTPEVVLSPTPTPTLTPTPVIKGLGDIFEGVPVNFEVGVSDNVGRDFKTFVGTLSVASKEFLKIDLVENIEDALVPLNFLNMFDLDLITYPTALRDNVFDSIVAVYGQSEMFNKDGNINSSPQNQKKTAFVATVKDRVAVQLAMKDWENRVAEDLADYMLISDTTKEANANFLDNTYRGISVRYKNFPFPDTTVDYAIVEAAGQNYLVIAGSREFIYAAIDVLLGQ